MIASPSGEMHADERACGDECRAASRKFRRGEQRKIDGALNRSAPSRHPPHEKISAATRSGPKTPRVLQRPSSTVIEVRNAIALTELAWAITLLAKPGPTHGMNRMKLVMRTAPLIAAVFLLTSCTDMGEVTEFAESSQKIGDSFADMAAEAERGCQRANRFVTKQNPVTPLNCDWYANINPSLAAVSNVLFAYIASLGRLASSDTSEVGAALDSVSDNLKKGDPNISDDSLTKASAASGLVKAIAEVWASGYRQRKAATIIKENNAAVGRVTDFLSDYAADQFRQTLSHEKAYEAIYCLNTASPVREPVATALLEKMCAHDEAQLDQKLEAIKAFQRGLSIIKTTHEKLAQQADKWDMKVLSKDLGPSIRDLAKAASTVRKTF
jgi:hypothetical protein